MIKTVNNGQKVRKELNKFTKTLKLLANNLYHLFTKAAEEVMDKDS